MEIACHPEPKGEGSAPLPLMEVATELALQIPPPSGKLSVGMTLCRGAGSIESNSCPTMAFRGYMDPSPRQKDAGDSGF